MILTSRDVMSQPMASRRELHRGSVLSRLDEPIRESPEFDAGLPELIRSVKAQGLEGLVAKRRDSPYEPGQRSGAWQKMRVSHGQEFVIAGYTPNANNFDAIIFGYYDGGKVLRRERNCSGASRGWRWTGARLPNCPKRKADAGALDSLPRK